ncbi:MAG: alpha/beta hydrolase [Nevskiales bacterium]
MSTSQRLISVALTAGAALILITILSTSTLSGFIGTLLAVLLLLCGAGWWLTDQARRLGQYTAWLGLLLAVGGVLGLLQLGWFEAGSMLLLGCVVMLVAGFASVWRMPLSEGIPAARVDLLLAVKVLLDELVMGYFLSSLKFPKGRKRQQVMQESRQALSSMQARGWLENPASMHPAPQCPEQTQRVSAWYKGHAYHKLFFDSSFTGLDLPGSERWLAQKQQVRARIFEHAGEPRPWLVCVHGYRMGWLPLDFQLFPPGWLHHKLGFNLLMPILPLHGQRRLGWRSGDYLFDGDVMDMLHAITQGVHDLRCLLAWIREDRGEQRIAMLGYSLGGLHAALVASLEENLDSLIAGIPLVDIPDMMWAHSPRSLVQDFEDQGLGLEQIQELLKPVSPLQLQPQLPLNRLGVAAASSDRLVPAAPVLELINHWNQSAPLWYSGSHLSVRRERVMRDWLQQQWQNAGLVQTGLNLAARAG